MDAEVICRDTISKSRQSEVKTPLVLELVDESLVVRQKQLGAQTEVYAPTNIGNGTVYIWSDHFFYVVPNPWLFEYSLHLILGFMVIVGLDMTWE